MFIFSVSKYFLEARIINHRSVSIAGKVCQTFGISTRSSSHGDAALTSKGKTFTINGNDVKVTRNTDHIVINGNNVKIKKDLSIRSKDLAEYLQKQDEGNIENAFALAAELGSSCLLKSDATALTKEVTDVLKEHIETEISERIHRIFEKSNRETDLQLTKVSNAISSQYQTNRKHTEEELEKIRQMIQSDIDPTNKESSISMAIQQIVNLLDISRTDSIPNRIEKTTSLVKDLLDKTNTESVPYIINKKIHEITELDGPLVKSVDRTIQEALKPVIDVVKEQQALIESNKQTNALVDRTTMKGGIFEEETLLCLQEWKKISGSQIEHCGTDNKKGDIMVTMKPTTNTSGIGSVATEKVSDNRFRIILELKNVSNNKYGVTNITKIMEETINERGADAGIFLCKNIDGFTNEVGDWAEGTLANGRNWIATTSDYVTLALRFLWANQRIQDSKWLNEKSKDRVDTEKLLTHIKEIRTTIGRTSQIKRKATQIEKLARTTNDEATEMSNNIKETLRTIEVELNSKQ